MTHGHDTTYLSGVLDLWATAETTCGILAICLVVSPRFFQSLQDSKLWSRFTHSSTRLKSEPTSTSHTPSEKDRSGKLDNSSHNLHAKLKRYGNFSRRDVALAPVPSKSSVESNIQDDKMEI